MALDSGSGPMVAAEGRPAGGIRFRGRHLTVGTAVAVSIMVAAIVTVVLQRWAFQAQVRWDLTSGGLNSLGAGTRVVLDSLADDDTVSLTSLYLETDIELDAQKKYRKAVNDLLRLYQAERPSRIEVEWINPLKDQGAVSRLLQRIRTRGNYPGEAQAYRAAATRFEEEFFKPFQALLAGLTARLRALPPGGTADGATPAVDLDLAFRSWLDLGEEVLAEKRAMDARPLPRHSDTLRNIRTFYETVGVRAQSLVHTYVDQQLGAAEVPEAVQALLRDLKTELAPWLERFTAEQQAAAALPPLSLDALEDTLKLDNVVVVETRRGAKAIPFDELWPAVVDGQYAAVEDFEAHRFAGEGAITPVILQLLRDQQSAVVFVRYAGPRLFGAERFGMGPGPLSELKTELERLDYQVAEWDLQRDAEPPDFGRPIQRTIYVVLRPGSTTTADGVPTGQSITLAQRAALLNAVEQSGRALFLTGWDLAAATYEYNEYLDKRWGIAVQAQDLVITAVPSEPGKWRLDQTFFTVLGVRFADHPLTRGLQVLQHQTVLPMATVLDVSAKLPEGVAVERLAETADTEDIWAVEDVGGLVQRYQQAGSVARVSGERRGPFTLALAAQKQDHKIVVLGAGEEFIRDDLAVIKYPVIGSDGKLSVGRQAPGNLVLFTNILHYLEDTLEWLNVGSPIDSSRLALTDVQWVACKWVTVGLFPALALLGGLWMWFVRRR